MIRSHRTIKTMPQDKTPEETEDPRNETLKRSLEQNNIDYELDESGNVKATEQVISFLHSKEALRDPEKPVVVKTKEELGAPQEKEDPTPPREETHAGPARRNKPFRAGQKMFLLNILTEKEEDSKSIAIRATNVDEAKGIAQLKHMGEFPDVVIKSIEAHEEKGGAA